MYYPLGVVLAIVVVAPSSLNPDTISDQKCHFNTRFQTRTLKSIPVSDLALRQKLCHGSSDQSINKKFIQMHFEFVYFYFFFFIWNWYEKYVYTLPLLARKPYSIPQKNLHPFSEQKGPKTKPFGAAHTYMAYISGFPLSRVLSNILFSASFICLLRSPQLGTLLKDHYDQQQTLWIIRFTTFCLFYSWNCDAIIK